MGIYDVPTEELIKRAAEELKKIDAIKAPEWAPFVKTGAHKELPPVELDWWYTRAAAVLRKIAILGPIGVSKLRRKYGGKKNRGHKPERFYKGSGNILRKVLQQLEKAELATKTEKGVYKGRVIAPKGHALLDKVATEIMKEMQITLPKKPEIKFTVKKKKKKAAKKTVKKTDDKKEEKTAKAKKPKKKRAVKKKKVAKKAEDKKKEKTELKAEEKPEAKEVQAETKSEAKEVKAEPKAEALPEAKEVKKETKVEEKPAEEETGEDKQ